jgi:predicted nucleic acid-binding protein
VHVDEVGSALVRERIADATLVATSLVAYVEAQSAFARRRRVGDLSPAEYRRIVADFEVDWTRYVVLYVTEALVREAAGFCGTHGLRGYDAIHLASARLVARRPGESVVFASWDTELERAAVREGFDSIRPRFR